MKKIVGDIIILHMCTKIHMVSEIQNETHRIFCHFGSFFALLTPPPPLMILKNQIFKKNEKNT